LNIVTSAAPLVVVQLSLQGTTIVVRLIASTLAPGVITALNLALTLTNIPLAVFAYALATVLVPALAQSVGHDLHRFQELYSRGVRAMVLVLTPAAGGLAVLAEPLVRVALQRGAFDRTATGLTAGVLGFYALSLAAQPFLVIGYRSLIAAERTRLVAAVEVSLNALLIVLTLLLGLAFAQAGIAAAYSVAAATGGIAYAGITGRIVGGSLGDGFGRYYLKVLAAAGMAAAAMYGADALFGRAEGWVGSALGLVAAITLGAGMYSAAVVALRLITIPQVLMVLRLGRGTARGSRE
jgi:putative peptidoglycan lipid II flippase